MIRKKQFLLILFLLVLYFIPKVTAQGTLLTTDLSGNQSPNGQSSNSLITDSLLIPNDSILKDEELPQDSITQKKDSTKSNAIDAPIQYAAKDSMVMTMDGHNMLYLYGEGDVKYKDLVLTGEYIEIDADSSIVFATFALDSIGEEFGYPLFIEGDSQYEMKKARYNFKTKKMFITDVITQQGEGYVTAGKTKKMENDDLFMRDGKYTTCDDHEHPHFYFQLTKAKVKPGKSIVTGPAYLVIEDVPLPIAIPFGFFPFTSDYSSGIIMPTYGDEMTRGFSLRDGGYYFAINDYVDLALTGEIHTKGSWGLNARSTYRKRYKYSGNVNAGYLVTIMGDKGSDDYSKTKDFKLAWTHSQDPKSNPFSTFSASVNFTTSSYDRNDLNSLYSNQYTQNTKSSTVNYTYRHPNSPFSFSANASINQVSRDTMVNITLPNLTITMSDIYPFKRKEQIGKARWYENIRLSYSGLIMNQVASKEYDLLEKNVIKDWKNGMKHEIPVSASFNLFKYITISPSFNYSERWYTSKTERAYDSYQNQVVVSDTLNGFYRLYNYNAAVSANTKLYGMYKPWGGFGKWAEKTQIRHVITPSVSFSGAPDFGDPKYGYYKDLIYLNQNTMQVDTLNYSPFANEIWGAPGRGRSGTMSFSLDNNLEMKIPIAGTDSTRKVSLIDNLRLGISYNFLADSLKWSDINASLRLKLSKSFTLNLQAVFDTYTYNENGRKIDVPRWEAGKGLGRLKTTGTSFSYTLNNSVVKNWFNKNDDLENTDPNSDNPPLDVEQANAVAVESGAEQQERTSLRKKKEKETGFDQDGYMLTDIPWSLSFNYSMSLGYGDFDKQRLEYKYRITQTLGISGSISPTKNWNFNFNTSYDFDKGKFATMQCSLSRQMHCWQMSASIIPIGPYQSYNFSIAVNSSLLKDLKYTQSSSYRDAMNWGD